MKHVSFLIKPASALCNMRYRYCFYADVSEHREVKTYGIMDDETMRALVDRALELSEDADITFAFQGGEPTCAGLGYFERFVTYVEERRQRQTVHFALQTNGYVIDDAWAEFFARHGFLVGVSLTATVSCMTGSAPTPGARAPIGASWAR